MGKGLLVCAFKKDYTIYTEKNTIQGLTLTDQQHLIRVSTVCLQNILLKLE